MEFPSKETAETIQALLTAAALLVGGGWAFWRWSVSESLRRRREIPSFEGQMSYSVLRRFDGRAIVSLNCRWKNMGVAPLPVNTKETRFALYSLPDELQPGPIGPRMNNLVEMHVRRPWEHWPAAVLEPGTNSELQAHFLVEADQVYVAMCRLEAVSHPKKLKQVWTRELVVKSSPVPATRCED